MLPHFPADPFQEARCLGLIKDFLSSMMNYKLHIHTLPYKKYWLQWVRKNALVVSSAYEFHMVHRRNITSPSCLPWEWVCFSLLPGPRASATLTFGQDVIHPFPGKAYIFISYLLSELSRHQTNNFFMILLKDFMYIKINKTILATPTHNNVVSA